MGGVRDMTWDKRKQTRLIGFKATPCVTNDIILENLKFN